MNSKPILGIIGGTGIYQLEGISNVRELTIETPFGLPSSPIMIGEIHNKSIAFLARHGIGHTIPPSKINYRANIYALKFLGVNKIISISACGSLREDFIPGDIVIPNQLIDFTKNRERTFFDTGLVAHIGSADPFCANLSQDLYNSVVSNGVKAHLGGALITIEGPRFSTKAESNLFRSWGLSIIGMTSSPEAFLAREAEICYAAFAHVTDFDVWHVSEESVTVEMIIRILNQNKEIAQKSIISLVSSLSEDPCECNSALKGAITTSLDHIDPKIKEKLSILVNKYLS
ncbi:MAG: S-methyl-5'-thioadenosine phosphorylase [Anaerolineaceae bacterium]